MSAIKMEKVVTHIPRRVSFKEVIVSRNQIRRGELKPDAPRRAHPGDKDASQGGEN
ncbi:hypothetical protein [Parachlamydia sp. AcF125]|uniref:hypothetical protein n=1 Tax=Parachlamydia sp. AcF125 TaxID=2795736 RepID=UPI00201601F5|nr:hypothetical protein [Parachlamydia sp. AcF125]